MEQMELPGMPSPPPREVDGRPVSQEHVTMKVYPPIPERMTWFVLVQHEWPGGRWSNFYEVDFAYTPAELGRRLQAHLQERFADLEPF